MAEGICREIDVDNRRLFNCIKSGHHHLRRKKLSAITEFTEGAVMKSLHDVITKMLGNQQIKIHAFSSAGVKEREKKSSPKGAEEMVLGMNCI